ncbi:uncharacterized protein LOC131240586 [Magnolia sinica]|uniref:uncharacterized protein LOC131240586 n=1 Tax=Magnolia sinica TaxID=86752 RepID=UPI0026583F96|nr:uncharacterized protein LOC131240586 [Magnolia sinica]
MPVPNDPPSIFPFQLLEINIISAQDLAPVTRAMRAYAIGWVHPNRKLSGRVDPDGLTNPTWNDKFVFRVDDSFLRSDTSAVTIEIYAVRCFRDVLVGTVRILVSNLFPSSPVPPTPFPSAAPISPPTRPLSFPTRFVALQVRRPSGRPQGILNIGVALLDGSMRSMPIYMRLTTSALDYRDLMGEPHNDPHHNHVQSQTQLRRTKSEYFSQTAEDHPSKQKSAPTTLKGLDLVVKTPELLWSQSELVPRPSDAARTNDDDDFLPTEVGSSVLEDWSEDSSIEGLKSKLERWRAELPPIYDHGYGSFKSLTTTAVTDAVGHKRSNTDGGGGLFSCFRDSFGRESSIFSGKPKAARATKMHVSQSDGNLCRSYAVD